MSDPGDFIPTNPDVSLILTSTQPEEVCMCRSPSRALRDRVALVSLIELTFEDVWTSKEINFNLPNETHVILAARQ